MEYARIVRNQANKRPLCVLGVIYILLVLCFAHTDGTIPSNFKQIYDQSISLVGQISVPVRVRQDKIEIEIKAIYAVKQKYRIPLQGKVLVVLPKEKSISLHYGQIIRISEKIGAPSLPRNPGSFHYQRYLITRNIYGIVRTKFSSIDVVRDLPQYQKMWDLQYHAFSFKAKLEQIFNETLSDETADFINAMMLGDKYLLSSEINESFSLTGLSHILAISGLHITFIFLIFSWLFQRMGLQETKSLWLLLGILLFYNLMTGFSPSIVRASLMGGYIVVGKLLHREPDLFTSIFLSAFCILLDQPLWIYDGGFLLSYGAVLSIVLMTSIFQRSLIPTGLGEKARGLIAVTFAAQLGILPILASLFYQISIVSFILNLVVVPLSTFMMVLALIVGALGMVHILLGILPGMVLDFLVHSLLWVVNSSLKLPYAYIVTGSPSRIQIVGYYLLLIGGMTGLWAKLQENKHLKPYVIATCTMGIFLLLLPLYSPKALEVTYIDVGQGDSIHIQTPGRSNILVDGGGIPRFMHSNFDVGKQIVVPYLNYKGIKTIDLLIVTHPDEDHILGTFAVLEKIRVKRILIAKPPKQNQIYREFVHKAKAKRIPIYYTKGKEKFTLDSIQGRILHPTQDYDTQDTASENNHSVVLYLRYNTVSFLLTGDLEEEGEEFLLRHYQALRATVLKLGHHGSKHSSSEGFLDALQPRIAIVSAGKNNRYKHPHIEVLNRLKERNIYTYRTDQQGAIMIKTDGRVIKVESMLNKAKTSYIMYPRR